MVRLRIVDQQSETQKLSKTDSLRNLNTYFSRSELNKEPLFDNSEHSSC